MEAILEPVNYKGTYEKMTAKKNITFNSELLKAFFPKIENKQSIYTLTSSIQHCTGELFKA